MKRFALTDVGEGLVDAEIVRWRVAVGDRVEINDVLVEIETAKSIVELPSPYAGVIEALLVAEGDVVPVGTDLVAFADESEPAAWTPVSTPPPPLVGTGPTETSSRRRAKVGDARPAPPAPSTGRVLAAPATRRVAHERGIDLAEVPTSGTVVTRDDIDAHAALPIPDPTPPLIPPAPVTVVSEVEADVRIPVRGVRRTMAETMTRSILDVPQATEWTTIDMTKSVELAERWQRNPDFEGVRISPTVIVAKAVCLALRRSPYLNATWDPNGAVILRGSVNLGIAVATDRGLLVPNIKRAHRLGMRELAIAMDDLVARARDGRAQPADQSGGTFTVTNIGALGVEGGIPILSPGETGILAVGAIGRRPWVDENDVIVPRWLTTLAVTFDHRAVDGAEAARFLADVGRLLQDPAEALTY